MALELNAITSKKLEAYTAIYGLTPCEAILNLLEPAQNRAKVLSRASQKPRLEADKHLEI
jgi:hypothetical protein